MSFLILSIRAAIGTLFYTNNFIRTQGSILLNIKNKLTTIPAASAAK